MRAKHSGFTLLEVIIAIAIFAAMYVFAQYAFTQALDNRALLMEHAAQQESRQRLLLQLSQDIEQLIARPVRDGFGDLEPALMGDDRHRVRGEQSTAQYLAIIARANRSEEHTSELQSRGPIV